MLIFFYLLHQIQFLHQLIDGMCGRSPALYTSFADIWSLEEWWLVIDCSQKLFSNSFARGWSTEQVLLVTEQVVLVTESVLILNSYL